jgi:hypothetical protein
VRPGRAKMQGCRTLSALPEIGKPDEPFARQRIGPGSMTASWGMVPGGDRTCSRCARDDAEIPSSRWPASAHADCGRHIRSVKGVLSANGMQAGIDLLGVGVPTPALIPYVAR